MKLSFSESDIISIISEKFSDSITINYKGGYCRIVPTRKCFKHVLMKSILRELKRNCKEQFLMINSEGSIIIQNIYFIKTIRHNYPYGYIIEAIKDPLVNEKFEWKKIFVFQIFLRLKYLDYNIYQDLMIKYVIGM